MASMPSHEHAGRAAGRDPGMVPARTTCGRGCAFAPRCDVLPAEAAAARGNWLLASRASVTAGACWVAALLPREEEAGIARARAGPRAREQQRRSRRREPAQARPLARPWFGKRRRQSRAVDDVSFTVERRRDAGAGRRIGLRQDDDRQVVVRLVEPTSGSVRLEGEELTTLSAERMRQRRKDLQIVFQDPYASLDPRLAAGEISPSRCATSPA
jgi:ABC-type dipeptide/oligopeptide/nickel transport system ATPase component